MSKIIWLPEALEDLNRLRSFLNDKSPTAAQRAGQTILEAANKLEKFPELGWPMNDGTGRRELFQPFGAGSYVLRYILDNKTIVIIRVWHSKENRRIEN